MEDFVESPCEYGLDLCTKKQLIAIAVHYQIDIGDTTKVKDIVKSNLKSKLFESEVLKPVAQPMGVALPLMPNATGLSYKQHRELLLLRLNVVLSQA